MHYRAQAKPKLGNKQTKLYQPRFHKSASTEQRQFTGPQMAV
jgi:hypothetical protein